MKQLIGKGNIFNLLPMKVMFIVMYLSALLSCNSGESTDLKKENLKSVSFEADRKSSRVSDPLSDSNYYIRCHLLGIESLRSTNIVHSEIRIWIDSYSVGDTGRVLILKNDGETWEAKFHGFRFNITSKGENYIVSHQVETGNARTGWNTYLTKIDDAGLRTLDDKFISENSALCTGGPGIEVEIAEKGRYKSYIYPCWDLIKDQTQLDKIQNILRLTEDQFGFRIYPIAPIEATVTSGPAIEFSDIEIKEKAK